ncbi:MAG: Rha family transcriptional regulator, partial [Candidatus Competibacteraceae bacterium]|nr:Rha family transcriptional regulator [Candidatus Competibacteraceae bacterium]
MNTITLSPQDYIQIADDTLKTTSLKVAEAFGKLHKNVISKIESLDCSEEFTELNFKPSEYMDSTGRKLPAYEMTKDGFVFLVMGFTGKKAAQVKEAYINAFNWMARQIQQVATSPSPKLTADQLRALQEAVQARANLLPPQLKGGAYPKLWGAVKSHFRVPSYRELPPEKFDDALSLIGRLPLEGELLSPGTDPAIAPAPRYHYPKSAITLAHVDAQPGWLTYQNLMDERSSHLLQDLLQQLSDQGHDVSGAILEYRAMLHVLEAQKFAMDSVEQSLARARQTGLR